jgi:hypothetical protein
MFQMLTIGGWSDGIVSADTDLMAEKRRDGQSEPSAEISGFAVYIAIEVRGHRRYMSYIVTSSPVHFDSQIEGYRGPWGCQKSRLVWKPMPILFSTEPLT